MYDCDMTTILSPMQTHFFIDPSSKTLFVVGVHESSVVREWAIRKDISTISFGYNHSFCTLGVNDAEGWIKWENMILPLLQEGWKCSLELDVKDVEGLHENGFCEFNNFTPIISVKIPYISLLNYNTTVKIDEIGQTNPGIWVHRLHSLMDPSSFSTETITQELV